MSPRLNLDAGELPDEPPALWAQFDILNIACGGHAGDTASMTRVVRFCIEHDIAIGAHPSYPDREHFGRRSLTIEPTVLHASLSAQCRALADIVRSFGARVQYVKPHGALYHDASRDPSLAALFVDATRFLDATLIGPRGHLASAARTHAVPFALEGFADRRMRPDGTLVPRTEPDALITSPALAAQQALSLNDVDTICVHADTPGSLVIARAVREAIEGAASVAASDAATTSGSWTPLGDRAVRFARPASVSPRALVAAMREWPGVIDVVVARHDVAAYFQRGQAPFTPGIETAPAQRGQAPFTLGIDLDERIAALATLPDLDAPVREHELRAIYDGPDLDEVARAAGLSTDEVIRAHVGAVYTVDTLGFAPGFAYLVGLDARLHVSRRATPRARVPAGGLAIAGEYTAVYPFASPGGWNLIGRVEERMFEPAHGAVLQLGDRVRFVR